MTRLEIKNLLLKQPHSIKNYNIFLKKHNLTHIFESMRVYDAEPFKEVAYRIKNDIYDIVLCKCGNPVNYDSGKYHEFCSTSCTYNKEATVKKLKMTSIERYGVDNPMKCDDTKKKFKDTMIERYGVEHALQHRQSMNKQLETKFNKFRGIMTSEHHREVSRKTMKHLNENGIIKNSVRLKYGVDNIMQTGITPKYNHKEYIMPSGKVILYQGYENMLLDELIKEYDEADIKTDRRDMPKFWYEYKGKKHRYFPDVYVTTNNTIYEVKSSYTLNKDYERNTLKFESVENSMYNFVLKVY